MDNFWIWLKKANARAVFFGLLAGLIVVTAWWAWKLTTPIRTAPLPAAGATHDAATPGLGILAYLQAQQANGTNDAANLFTPATGSTQSPSSPKREKADPVKIQQSKPEPSKTPPPARVREVITLTYRGLYVRGDGVPMAMIADSKSRRAAFYSAGTNLFGLVLKTVEAEKVGMDGSDQSSIILKRGIPQAFEEGRHAN